MQTDPAALAAGKRRRPRRPPAYAEFPPVPVWDTPVRLFHWSIVVLFAALLATGLAGGDWLAWHMRAGQLVLILVLFRVAWGFAGSRNARFRAFVRGPRSAGRYARSLARRSHEPFATHNPLGAWMVVFLLAALLVQVLTGLFTNDDVLWDGPLVKWVTKETSDQLSSLHRKFWWALVALVALHVTAAIGYLVAFRENLIRAMVTGRKRLPPGIADPAGAHASRVKALAILVACGALVWVVVYRL